MQISWILYILFDSYYLHEIILEFIGFIGGLIGWKRVDDYRAIDRIGRFWSKRYGAHSFSVSSAGCFGMICHRLHFNNQKKKLNKFAPMSVWIRRWRWLPFYCPFISMANSYDDRFFHPIVFLLWIPIGYRPFPHVYSLLFQKKKINIVYGGTMCWSILDNASFSPNFEAIFPPYGIFLQFFSASCLLKQSLLFLFTFSKSV